MNSDSDIAPVLHPRTHTHTAKQTGTKGMQVTAVALRALGPLVGEIPPAARRRRIPAALAVGRHGATAQREPPRPPRPATLAASFPASPSRPLHPPTASATPSAVASATQPQPSSRACADCGMRFFFFGGGVGWGGGGVGWCLCMWIPRARGVGRFIPVGGRSAVGGPRSVPCSPLGPTCKWQSRVPGLGR